MAYLLLKKNTDSLYVIIALLVFLLSSKFCFQFIFDANETEGKLLPVWLFIYVISTVWVFFIKKRNPKYIFFNKKLIFLFLFLFYLTSSFLWSTDLLLSLKKSIALVLTGLFPLYLMLFLSWNKVDSLFNLYFLSILFGTITLYFIDESLVMMDSRELVTGSHLGSWRGALGHKNYFGKISALASLYYLAKYIFDKKFKYFILSIAFMGFIFLSNSFGSILLFVIGAFLLVLIYSYNKKKYILRNILLAIVIISFVVIGVNYVEILALGGKSADFTGRIPLWERSFYFFEKKWLMGYGYSSFWEHHGFSNKMRIVGDSFLKLNWDAPHSHNIFIEILLAGGIIGLLLYLLLLFNTIKSFKLSSIKKEEQNSLKAFLIILFFNSLLIGVFENAPIVQNDIQFIFFIFSVVAFKSILNE